MKMQVFDGVEGRPMESHPVKLYIIMGADLYDQNPIANLQSSPKSPPCCFTSCCPIFTISSTYKGVEVISLL